MIERGGFGWSVVACADLGEAFLGSDISCVGGKVSVIGISAVGE